jgi:hypothetical protein
LEIKGEEPEARSQEPEGWKGWDWGARMEGEGWRMGKREFRMLTQNGGGNGLQRNATFFSIILSKDCYVS